MEKIIHFIFLLIPTSLFSQATSLFSQDCEGVLDSLMNKCDNAINQLLTNKFQNHLRNQFEKDLQSFSSNTCLDIAANKITQNFILATKNLPPATNQKKSAGVKRNYDEKVIVYTSKLLIYRQYLQMELFELRQRKEFQKVDMFIKKDSIYKHNDSIYKYKDSIYKHNDSIYKHNDTIQTRKIRDSLADILKILKSLKPDINYNANFPVNFSDSFKKQTDEIKSEIEKARQSIYKVLMDSDYKKQRIEAGNIISVGASQYSLYSLSYSHVVRKSASYSWMAGAEIVVPINSMQIKHPGAFILGSIQEQKLLFQFGVGWLRNQSNNISWKSALGYFPGQVGLTIHYSPLTGFGSGVAFKLL